MGSSNNQYADISREYQRSKELPFRKHIEEYTLFSLLGDVSNKSVLDLACGEGHYTRLVAEQGARNVTGVDLSGEMISLAIQQESKNPLGIKYHVSDAATFSLNKKFDVIMAAYLLNYAKDVHQLELFCKTIYSHLKPGGIFVAFNDNPNNSPKYFKHYKKYGFVKAGSLPQSEGDPIRYTLYNQDQTKISFDNYYMKASTIENSFENIGFSKFCWHAIQLDPNIDNKLFWREFLEHPPMIAMTANK